MKMIMMLIVLGCGRFSALNAISCDDFWDNMILSDFYNQTQLYNNEILVNLGKSDFLFNLAFIVAKAWISSSKTISPDNATASKEEAKEHWKNYRNLFCKLSKSHNISLNTQCKYTGKVPNKYNDLFPTIGDLEEKVRSCAKDYDVILDEIKCEEAPAQVTE